MFTLKAQITLPALNGNRFNSIVKIKNNPEISTSFLSQLQPTAVPASSRGQTDSKRRGTGLQLETWALTGRPYQEVWSAGKNQP